MRRTFACTQLILHSLNLGGMDVRTLQTAMGHARLDTTQEYLADADEYIGSVKRHLNTRDGARLIAEPRQPDDRQSESSGTARRVRYAANAEDVGLMLLALSVHQNGRSRHLGMRITGARSSSFVKTNHH